jgi:hypothetical protein
MKPDPVVVAAGLQDQHAVGGIGRQPVGDDAAGGARADDDIVEITFKPLHKASPREPALTLKPWVSKAIASLSPAVQRWRSVGRIAGAC